MGEDYTPTDEQVRVGFVAALQWAAEAERVEVDESKALASYDRWLAAHDRQVRAQVLRDAADDWQPGAWGRGANWLRDRADAEERGE